MKDFFDELKIRINNPLISAFFISLFFCNIKVALVLFFYKQSELVKLDKVYSSYLDFINKTTDIWTLLLLPMIFAASYVWLSPYIRGFIESYHAILDAKQVTKVLEQTNGDKMPLELHREKIGEANKKRQEYVELITQQGTMKDERDAAKADIVDLKIKHDQEVEKLKIEADERFAKLTEQEKERIKNLDDQYKVRVDQLTETIGRLRVAEEMMNNQISIDKDLHTTQIDALNEQYQATILDITNSKDETARQLREKIEELNKFQISYTTILADRDNAYTRIEDLMKENQIQTVTMQNDHINAIEGLRSEFGVERSHLQSEFNRVSQQHTLLYEEHVLAISEKDRLISEINKHLEELQNSYNQVENARNTLESEVDTLRRNYDSLSLQVQVLQETIGEHETTILRMGFEKDNDHAIHEENMQERTGRIRHLESVITQAKETAYLIDAYVSSTESGQLNENASNATRGLLDTLVI